jgi:guanylate kinase
MEEKMAIILSAPSGSGKTSIVEHLLSCDLKLEFSVSATSRAIRGSEQNGREYYFLSPAEFRMRIERGEFIEWEEVYKDRYYGTLRSELNRIWEKGNFVLFDVDVKGGISLKKIFHNSALSIFIMPPSVAELRKRLLARKTDSMQDIEMRINKAEEELKSAAEFDKVLVNDVLEQAKSEAQSLVQSFLRS